MGLAFVLDVTGEDELVAEFAVHKKLNTRFHQRNSYSGTRLEEYELVYTPRRVYIYIQCCSSS